MDPVQNSDSTVPGIEEVSKKIPGVDGIKNTDIGVGNYPDVYDIY